MENNNTQNTVPEQENQDKQKKQRIGIIAGITIAIIVIIALILGLRKQASDNNELTTTAIDELQTEVTEVDGAADGLKTQLDDMLTQLDTMDQVINKNKETVESIDTVSGGSSENIKRVEQDAIELQNTLNDYIKEFETTTNETNASTKEQFEKVNKEIEDMLNTINNNNEQQNTNYKDLQSQMKSTLESLNKTLDTLSKENQKQYEDLSKQVKTFEDSLNKYLEETNKELNETIQKDVDGINTHLDEVQADIANTKQEITDLMNAIDAKQTADIQAKFDAIQKHLDDITAHFDETLANITDLINKLSEQNAQEFADTIAKLTSVQSDLTTLNNQNTDALSTQLKNMQADYTSRLEALENSVNNSFNDVNTKIEEGQTSVEESIKNLRDDVTNNFKTQSDTLNNINNNVTNNFNTIINGQNTDTKELEDLIKSYQEKVDQSFTSVANGKQEIATALATKNQTVANDATFADLTEAILNINQEVIVELDDVIYKSKKMKITAHFHTSDGDTNKTFDTFEEYKTYLNSLEDSTYSVTPGGCYTTTKHKDWEVVGTRQEQYQSYEVVGTKESCRPIYRNECFSAPIGTNNPTGWCGTYYDHSECVNVPDYGYVTRTRTVNTYDWVEKNKYDLNCEYSQGQIIGIELVDFEKGE